MSLAESSFPQPPPVYSDANPVQKNGYQKLPTQDVTGPHEDDVWNETEDDFKYGPTVSTCAPEIKRAFIRKVYSILTMQIMCTAAIGLVMRQDICMNFVMQNVWAFYLPMVMSFVFLGLCYWKEQSSPTNLFMLAGFTISESIFLGIAVAQYDAGIVLQALGLTTVVFVGLSLFTFQSRYDFSGMGPYLFGGLMSLIGMGFVGMFFPAGRTFDLVYSGIGTVLFSAYILYDTDQLLRRLSHDQWLRAVLSLYLDAINLFLSILRLLQSNRRE